MSIELREYQEEAIKKINEAFDKHQSVLLQMPTGTGKTEVFSKVIQDFYKEFPNKRIIIIVHREQLMNQIKVRLSKFNLIAETVEANKSINENSRIHVCMRQSLMNRNPNFTMPSLIVIDEAHHAPSKQYIQLLKRFKGKETKLLGVTATPVRLDSRSLCDIFEILIESKPISWFIPEYLSPLKYYGIRGWERLNKLKIDEIKNDYELDSSYQMMREENVMKEIIVSYQKLAKGKKTLIFCVHKEHALDVKKRFDREDIISEIINADTKAEERLAILNSFRKNEINVLINIEIFTEGFDCPDIEVVILARPTKSLSLYLQMIGRVTRKAVNGSTNFKTVLDNAGNWQIHGLPTTSRNWSELFVGSEGPGPEKPEKPKNGNDNIKIKKPLPLEDTDLNMYELTNPEDPLIEEEPRLEDDIIGENFIKLNSDAAVIIKDRVLQLYIITTQKMIDGLIFSASDRKTIKNSCKNIIEEIFSSDYCDYKNDNYINFDKIQFDLIKPTPSKKSNNVISITPDFDIKDQISEININPITNRSQEILNLEDKLFLFTWTSLKKIKR